MLCISRYLWQSLIEKIGGGGMFLSQKVQQLISLICSSLMIFEGTVCASKKVSQSKGYTSMTRRKGGKTYKKRVFVKKLLKNSKNLKASKKVRLKKNLLKKQESVVDNAVVFAKSVCNYVQKNPGESAGYLIGGVVGASVLGHIPNYVGQYRVNNLYVPEGDNDGLLSKGRNGCTGVWRVKYKNPTDEQQGKNYIMKGMRRIFSSGYWLAFEREKFACEMFRKFKEIPDINNNEAFKHLVPIVDYHYGIGSEYVVYEDAGKNDWLDYIKDKSIEEKVKGLYKIFKQVINAEIFLLDRDVCHGDLHPTNYYTELKEGEPFAKIFDYGCMHKTDFWNTILAKDSLNRELEKILRGFISLAAYVIEGGEGKNIDTLDDKEWKVKFNDWLQKFFTPNREEAYYKGVLITYNDKAVYLKDFQKFEDIKDYQFLSAILLEYWNVKKQLDLTEDNSRPTGLIKITGKITKDELKQMLGRIIANTSTLKDLQFGKFDGNKKLEESQVININ